MKKLAFLGAIAASACALAEVTSSNVVGYKAKTLEENQWNFVCSMFNPRVGQKVSSSSMLLGDIVPSETWDWMQDTLKTLTRNAGVAGTFTYISKEVCEEFAEANYNITPGWYAPSDIDAMLENEEGGSVAEKCKNAEPVAVTLGFAVQVSNKKTTLTFAGEVLAADQPVSLMENAWNFTGNYSPADITLAEITTNSSWDWMSDKFSILSKSFGISNQYTYISESVCEEFAEANYIIVPGWYIPADIDEMLENEEGGDISAKCQNAVEVSAGQGFAVQVANSKTILTIPSALSE